MATHAANHWPFLRSTDDARIRFPGTSVFVESFSPESRITPRHFQFRFLKQWRRDREPCGSRLSNQTLGNFSIAAISEWSNNDRLNLLKIKKKTEKEPSVCVLRYGWEGEQHDGGAYDVGNPPT